MSTEYQRTEHARQQQLVEMLGLDPKKVVRSSIDCYTDHLGGIRFYWQEFSDGIRFHRGRTYRLHVDDEPDPVDR